MYVHHCEEVSEVLEDGGEVDLADSSGLGPRGQPPAPHRPSQVSAGPAAASAPVSAEGKEEEVTRFVRAALCNACRRAGPGGEEASPAGESWRGGERRGSQGRRRTQRAAGRGEEGRGH